MSGFASVGWAQDTSTDALYITGRADRMASAAGGEAGVQWLRTVSAGAGFHAGGAAGSIAENWWLSGRLGGHRRWGAMTASGIVDFGRASDISRRFNYGGVKGGIAIPLAPTVVVEAHAQHLTFSRHPSQQVYQSSVSWSMHRSSSFQAGYHRLSARGGSADLVSGRLDVTAGNIGWIAGAVFGPLRQADALAVQLGLTPPSREFFGGCKFRVGRYELSTVLNVTHSGVRVGRALFGVRIPLSERKD